LREHEAASLLLQALGTLNRQARVLVMNTRIQGQPTALTLIPGATFAQDLNGNTILNRRPNEYHTRENP
jgi:hypothetical protein